MNLLEMNHIRKSFGDLGSVKRYLFDSKKMEKSSQS